MRIKELTGVCLISSMLLMGQEECPGTKDQDRDGYQACEDVSDPGSDCDCDDSNATVYPGAPEICDGLDTNCDGFGDTDTDNDGICDLDDLCLGDDQSGDTDGDGLCDNRELCEPGQYCLTGTVTEDDYWVWTTGEFDDIENKLFTFAFSFDSALILQEGCPANTYSNIQGELLNGHARFAADDEAAQSYLDSTFPWEAGFEAEVWVEYSDDFSDASASIDVTTYYGDGQYYLWTFADLPLLENGSSGDCVTYSEGSELYDQDVWHRLSWRMDNGDRDIIDGSPNVELLTPASTQPAPTEMVWDVQALYGVTADGLQQAVNDAIAHFNSDPYNVNDVIVLDITAGQFKLDKPIYINELHPGPVGRLVIQGQGTDDTILVDVYHGDGDETPGEETITFYGSSIDHLTMRNFSLTADRIFSTQGTVVSVAQGEVVIQLDAGYPGIDELFETDTTEANKMRLIDDSNPDNPNFVLGPDDDLYYYRWSWQGYETEKGPENLGNGEWKFSLVRDEVPPFKPGDRMAISSKCGQSNWGFFDGGALGSNDLVFENIELTRLGRIKFRKGWNGLRFTNVSIARRKWQGITAFYSSDAGPQLGHDEDEVPLKNVIVENCSFVGTTDDATAAQRVVSGRFSNNYWEDGGGVLMGEHVGCDVEVYDNEHNCCPLEDFAGCGFDAGDEHCDGPTLEERG